MRSFACEGEGTYCRLVGTTQPHHVRCRGSLILSSPPRPWTMECRGGDVRGSVGCGQLEPQDRSLSRPLCPRSIWRATAPSGHQGSERNELCRCRHLDRSCPLFSLRFITFGFYQLSRAPPTSSVVVGAKVHGDLPITFCFLLAV
jgi:hypothetical protein